MTGTIETTYRQYLIARREERLTGKGGTRRLELKADLAKTINDGQGDWLLQRYKRQVPGFGKRYGEIAAELSDGNMVPNRREPSLAESILATQERLIIYQEIVERCILPTRCIIQVGSTSWGENFDMRMSGNNPSDLDLELVVDDVNPGDFQHIPGLESALATFKPLYERGLADYLAHSYERNGWPVSVHVMPSAVMERHCQIDCTTIDQPVLANEFRIKPKSKPPIYNERYDAVGIEYVFEGHPEQVAGGQITQVPVMMVGDNDRVVMGLVMSKYFCYPHVVGNREWFETHIARFKKSLAQRIQLEGSGRFSELPARKARMPYYLKLQLDKEQSDYV